MVATDYVARSAKDGYTLLFGTIATTINTTLMPDKAPNVEKDHDADRARRLDPQYPGGQSRARCQRREGPDRARQSRSRTNCSMARPASAADRIWRPNCSSRWPDIKMTGVLYPGSGQTAIDLIAGRIQVMFAPASTVLGLYQGRPRQSAGDDRSQTRERRARSADDRRSGPARLRRRPLVRHPRPGRHAEAGHRHISEATNNALKDPEVLKELETPGPECARRQPG